MRTVLHAISDAAHCAAALTDKNATRYRLTATQRTNEAHFDLFIGDAKIGTVTQHLTIRDKPFRVCLDLFPENEWMFGDFAACGCGENVDEAITNALSQAKVMSERIAKTYEHLRLQLIRQTPTT